jgi:hypothetical protein
VGKLEQVRSDWQQKVIDKQEQVLKKYGQLYKITKGEEIPTVIIKGNEFIIIE